MLMSDQTDIPNPRQTLTEAQTAKQTLTEAQTAALAPAVPSPPFVTHEFTFDFFFKC